MILSDFSIEIADYQRELPALRAVREAVFVAEQQVPLEIELDALDPECRHVLARDLAGNAIGTGRLSPQRRIGRMAVLPDWRNRGVGAALLQALVDLARGLRYPDVELHAQLPAVAFYRRHGFEPHGEEFVEAGIRHVTMRRELAPFATAPPRQLPETPPPGELLIDSLEQARNLTATLIADARRSLWVLTRDLDPLLLGHPEALAGLRRIATGGHEVEIRIVLHDPATALREGHPLIGIAQRLSSAFRFRTPVDEVDLQNPAAFVINDRGGYFFRPLASRFDGNGSRYAPARRRQLAEAFGPVWERSVPSVELRELHL